LSQLAIGLLGSGEFEPWSEVVDRSLLARARRGDGRVLILPTASAPEGEEVFEMWGQKGLDHYRHLGIDAEVVPLRTKADAENAAFAARLRRASMVFFSGGNPAYLAATLAGTRFWRALRWALPRGLAYAGCSAGAACLGPKAPDSSARELTSDVWRPGLGVFPSIYVAPHWDALDSYVPGLTAFFVAAVPATCKLLAIDELTAIAGDGVNWTVLGKSAAHLWENGAWLHFPAGTSFSLQAFRRIVSVSSSIVDSVRPSDLGL
jgi:cyanophycinase